ncbi:MAG: DNA-packaging protein, partial [Lentisphaeria bacterium]|nr:DNA-packaging protein [Lentisphaeria bacterium]
DYPSVQTALTRLAQNVPGLINRAFYDCNPPPRSHWCYQLFVGGVDPADRTALAHPEIYSSLRINPEDNRANLPAGYIEGTLANLPERQRRRFLLGEWGDDTEGALWTQSLIDRTRVVNAPELVRIVVGVDPAVTSGEGSDLSGIVAVGLGEDGDFYVLADRSLKASPSIWGGEVVKLYHELDADRVVGEVNNGGDLIENLLRQIDPDLSYRDVRATRGKILRAEPVVALYEKGRVHHVGRFADLEDQMTGYSPQFSAKSPDRMDALVWAITELMRGGSRLILA